MTDSHPKMVHLLIDQRQDYRSLEQGLLSSFMPTEVEISAKDAKISKYMEISREQRTLQP